MPRKPQKRKPKPTEFAMPVFFSRPPRKPHAMTFEEYRAWIQAMTNALGGKDTMTAAEWREAYRDFVGKRKKP